MSKININVGETYYVRVKVTELMDDKIITRTVSDKGSPLIESHTIFFDDEVLAFSHVPPPAPIAFFKSTVIPEAYPKYDPCRKFRMGDKVRFQKVNNRFTHELDATLFVGTLGRVAFDERESGAVKVLCFDGVLRVVDANYLELVTPVEELGPYVVRQDAEMECFEVYKHEYTEGEESEEKVWNIVRTAYFYGDNQGLRTLAEAKAAAEDECKRLNADYRKEMEK